MYPTCVVVYIFIKSILSHILNSISSKVLGLAIKVNEDVLFSIDFSDEFYIFILTSLLRFTSNCSVCLEKCFDSFCFCYVFANFRWFYVRVSY